MNPYIVGFMCLFLALMLPFAIGFLTKSIDYVSQPALFVEVPNDTE